MQLPDGRTLLNIVLIVVAVGLAWMIFRALFRTAARLFTVGCLIVAALLAVGWWFGWWLR